MCATSWGSLCILSVATSAVRAAVPGDLTAGQCVLYRATFPSLSCLRSFVLSPTGPSRVDRSAWRSSSRYAGAVLIWFSLLWNCSQRAEHNWFKHGPDRQLNLGKVRMFNYAWPGARKGTSASRPMVTKLPPALRGQRRPSSLSQHWQPTHWPSVPLPQRNLEMRPCVVVRRRSESASSDLYAAISKFSKALLAKVFLRISSPAIAWVMPWRLP